MASQTSTRWRMPPNVETPSTHELRRARSDEPVEQRWAALEHAHILSQPWPIRTCAPTPR